MARLGAGQVYPSDLTDAQWAVLEALLPKRQEPGRSQRYPLRLIITGIV